jgi:NADP-dependent 3-hydroxy acid dehydrogenase YdfG
MGYPVLTPAQLSRHLRSIRKLRGSSTSATASARVAVVTGGARGVGLAIAKRFLDKGYRVALLDIDRKALAATEKRLADHERVLA